MTKSDSMVARLKAQSNARKTELEATAKTIKSSSPSAPVSEHIQPSKASEKKTAPKKALKAKPSKPSETVSRDDDDGIVYEAKRGRKAKYQFDDPRRATTIVFRESQYQRLKKYAFDNNMSISDVLIEAFAQMTGEA